MESRRRSIAKAISYRIISSILTALIAWGLSGQMALGLKIGAVDAITKLLGYFLHERVWARIKWGTPKAPEYEI
jgi:uncharacterized membrane protein